MRAYQTKSNIGQLTLAGLFTICLLGIFSCGTKNNIGHEIVLDPNYQQIKTISTFAQCKGPNGNYTTEVISNDDGSLFFTQTYDYRDTPFAAKLTSDGKGYSIDESENIVDTLSNVSVEIIRSHDFHWLQIDPGRFFDSLTFESKTSQETEIYSGKDNLNHPMKIYYDKNIQQIKRIELLNMMDTTELIVIVNKKWTDSDYGKMVKEVEIIQAERDTFHFNFEKIDINK